MGLKRVVYVLDQLNELSTIKDPKLQKGSYNFGPSGYIGALLI